MSMYMYIILMSKRHIEYMKSFIIMNYENIINNA